MLLKNLKILESKSLGSARFERIRVLGFIFLLCDCVKML